MQFVSRSALIFVLALACNTSSATNVGDASAETSTDDAPFVTSPHALPTPMPTNGGGVLVDANVVVVTFVNYTYSSDLESMADFIPSSTWLAAVGAEYGIGTPNVFAKIRLSTAAPSIVKAADFTSWMIAEVGTDLPSPPNANTFYAVIFPSGAAFSDPNLGTMCDSFTGYHDAVATNYTFAAIGTCPKHVAGLTDVEQVERVFSHELIEALTDPFGTGYAARNSENPWSYVDGGEVADVCNGYTREDGFLAVRSWSNASAAKDLDPCEPNDVVAPYFNVSLPQTSVAHVSAGSQMTYALTGYSNANTSDWFVDPIVGTQTFSPSITFASSHINNGTTTTISIAVPSTAVSGSIAAILMHSLHGGDSTYALQPLVLHVD